MTTLKGANVTKVEAGGTGDNIVSDGYIKTVEKVWMDSYAVDAALTTANTIVIAKLPANKKLSSVEINIPALGTATNSTISLGKTTPTDGTGDASYGKVETWNTAAETLFSLPNAGRQAVTSAATDIYLHFSPATTLTGVTIKSIVRYT